MISNWVFFLYKRWGQGRIAEIKATNIWKMSIVLQSLWAQKQLLVVKKNKYFDLKNSFIWNTGTYTDSVDCRVCGVDRTFRGVTIKVFWGMSVIVPEKLRNIPLFKFLRVKKKSFGYFVPLLRVVSKTREVGNSHTYNALITQLLLHFKHNVAIGKPPNPLLLFHFYFYFNF